MATYEHPVDTLVRLDG